MKPCSNQVNLNYFSSTIFGDVSYLSIFVFSLNCLIIFSRETKNSFKYRCLLVTLNLNSCKILMTIKPDTQQHPKVSIIEFASCMYLLFTFQALYKHWWQHDIDQRPFVLCHPLQGHHKPPYTK